MKNQVKGQRSCYVGSTRVVDSHRFLTLHIPCGNLGRPLVAKCARAVTIPESDGGNAVDNNHAKRNANFYLEIEAQINSKLVSCTMTPRNSKDTQYQLQLLQKRHLAPYVGECKVNDTTYLVWEASGGENTLEDYIEMDNGWEKLAVDLGLGSNHDFVVEEERKETIAKQQRQNLQGELAAEVLRQILKGLAYCHSCGIVHRDIKVHHGLVVYFRVALTDHC